MNEIGVRSTRRGSGAGVGERCTFQEPLQGHLGANGSEGLPSQLKTSTVKVTGLPRTEDLPWTFICSFSLSVHLWIIENIE